MSNFVLDALGLFRRKRITKTPLDSDFIMLASTNVGNRNIASQGQMRARLIRATDLGQACPPVYKDTEDAINSKTGAPDPCTQIADGANCQQYYKMQVLGSPDEEEGPCPSYTLQVGTVSGKSIVAPPAGTYIIIVEYSLNNPVLGSVQGVLWPLGVAPTWTNTSGSRDIITVVSDGEVARGVATLGYTA